MNLPHFDLPQFTDIQKRVIYIALALSIALASIFYTFTQTSSSHAATELNIVATPTVPPMVVVDVAGKVLHPGVYTLPSGSRAIDAIKEAGNALPGVSLTDINLAHILVDGEQIIVGAPPVAVSTNKSGNGISKSSSQIISVNSATINQLQVLKGIGPVTAKRIVDYRKAHGAFSTLEEFRKVSKLGTTKFAAIKKQLRL